MGGWHRRVRSTSQNLLTILLKHSHPSTIKPREPRWEIDGGFLGVTSPSLHIWIWGYLDLLLCRCGSDRCDSSFFKNHRISNEVCHHDLTLAFGHRCCWFFSVNWAILMLETSSINPQHQHVIFTTTVYSSIHLTSRPSMFRLSSIKSKTARAGPAPTPSISGLPWKFRLRMTYTMTLKSRFYSRSHNTSSHTLTAEV